MPVLCWDILRKKCVLGCLGMFSGVFGCPGVLRLTARGAVRISIQNWTGIPSIDVFSARIDKIRGKIYSTSSCRAACKLNTVERSDDLSNDQNRE